MNLDWVHWHPDPGVLDGLVVVSLLYAAAVGPLRRWIAPEEAFPRREACWFYGAVLVLFLAVGTPLDEIGEKYSFAAHMLQHTLLIYPVPVMILLGTPAWILRPLVSLEWSRPLFYFLTRPLVAALLFNVCLILWHLPGLYEWALRDPRIHFLEHASFIGVALLAWWPAIPRLPEFPGLHPGPALLYLLPMGIAQSPLFAFLTFSGEVYYPTYASAPRLWNITPIEDQILGGVLMKVVGMAVMFAAMAVAFYRWHSMEWRSETLGPVPSAQVRQQGVLSPGLGDQLVGVENALDEPDQAHGREEPQGGLAGRSPGHAPGQR
ncbi:MAG: cytochrome c oxidase assembly protein [Armatimonadetes bacterium]|nr:cytochrome c oxidase assembly protein [Armatimonadota bacterium]